MSLQIDVLMQGFLATLCCTAIKFEQDESGWNKMGSVKHVNAKMFKEPVESASFFFRPNRSLSKKGRSLWLALIFASTTLIALAAFAIGAWMIVPFAGMEVALVWLAFHIVGLHDADYEHLSVDAQEFCWEKRCGNRTNRLKGSRNWASFGKRDTRLGCEIHLQYGGKRVEVGQSMSREQRERLVVDLGQVFRRIPDAD